jgi:putative ABC transport system permease protein
MIKNYLLIAIRSLKKQLAYSTINVFGLALGLAAILLITLWISDELSYDRFHENGKNIYRVSVDFRSGEMSNRTNVSPAVLLPSMLKDVPELETGVRLFNPSSFRPMTIAYQDNIFQETQVLFADSSFFKVFSFKLLQGDPAKVLAAPNSIVLTEKAAKKYFGDEDAINKILLVNATREYLVTGIAANTPGNSHIQFDFLASFHTLQAATETTWSSANYQTYVLAHRGSDQNVLEAKISSVFQSLIAPLASSSGYGVTPILVPLYDMYLHSDVDAYSDIRYIYIFSAIALLILIIACINYVNLATARATARAKEVGVRKVMGAFRKQLIAQFLSESVLITLAATVLALLTAQLLLPFFNLITGKFFVASDIFSVAFLSSSLMVLVTVSLLAGLYPAFIISKFNPAKVLKGNFKNSSEGTTLRKTLVTFQFIISAVLIVSTVVVMQQLDFIQNRKLGYDKENIIRVPYDNKTDQIYSGLYAELVRQNYVDEVARAGESPVTIRGGYTLFMDGMEEGNSLPVTGLATDVPYTSLFNMELLAGRNFTNTDFELTNNERRFSFIINESTARALLLDNEEIIGKRIMLNGREGEVVGVISDFHFASMHNKINPLVIFPENDFNYLFIKMRTTELHAALAQLKNIWKELLPHRPFEYNFIDAQFQSLYQKEVRISQLFSAFAVLAIIIACLGLFGLISYSASQRAKEIGVRKVLGAKVSDIILLLTRDYSKQVFIALIIGVPLAYWIMQQWLIDFSYRIELNLMPLLITTIIAALLTLITIGTQAWRAAMADPANTLRDE